MRKKIFFRAVRFKIATRTTRTASGPLNATSVVQVQLERRAGEHALMRKWKNLLALGKKNRAEYTLVPGDEQDFFFWDRLGLFESLVPTEEERSRDGRCVYAIRSSSM